MTLTATDYFCGMGGSSSGLVEAGYTIQVAANHWARAIETHSANHPDTEHLCEDIQKVDVRYLPKTDLLWASPICTELSPAGGRKRRPDPGQVSLWEEHGHVPAEALERTRVTFWEVLRSAEVHEHKVILVENVVEAADWHLLPTWLHGWTTLGYNIQVVCVSAAHVGDQDNDPAPQWRDRVYFVISSEGVRLPDVEPRPVAYCETCGIDVRARQWWKPGKGKVVQGHRFGKYGPQYFYVCPVGNHGRVEPYVAPAAAAIDWTDLGTRIGDRESLGMRPLGDKTLARIRLGLNTIAAGRFVFAVNHDGNGRHFDPAVRPLPTATVKRGEGMVTSGAFLSMFRNHGGNHPVEDPAQTFSAGGFHHGLTVPPGAFISAHHGGYADGDPSLNKSVDEPLRVMTTQQNKSLVVPYRKGANPYPASSSPLSTMATREAHGLLRAAIAVEDCRFRMLSPRESANAQRFGRSYVIHGNEGEKQMQAGNAVAVNVAHWLGRQSAEVL